MTCPCAAAVAVVPSTGARRLRVRRIAFTSDRLHRALSTAVMTAAS
jgi:hypothetical protein